MSTFRDLKDLPNLENICEFPLKKTDDDLWGF